MVRIDEQPKDAVRALQHLIRAIEQGWVIVNEIYAESDTEVKLSCGHLTKPIEGVLTIKCTSLMGEVCNHVNH